jgi:hypothetical protein
VCAYVCVENQFIEGVGVEEREEENRWQGPEVGE